MAQSLNKGNYVVLGNGTVGASVTLTPDKGQKKAFRIIVNAPSATASATLKVYKDSVAAGNLIWDGYMMQRDADGAVHLPTGSVCTTSWIVLVTGGSGSVYVTAEYA